MGRGKIDPLSAAFRRPRKVSNVPAKRILVVDDHQLLREGIRSLLAANGYTEVAEAADGRTAVEIAKTFRPQIVLMDLTMPHLNGADATRQLLAATPGAKVIAISARTDSTIIRDALRAGASAFVPKVAAFEELVAALHAVERGESYLSPTVTGDLVESYIRAGDGAANGNGPARDAGRPLTDREREVLQLVAEGLAMKQIAVELSVSVKTIETHRRQIMDKLDLFSVAELTKYAIRHGLTTN